MWNSILLLKFGSHSSLILIHNDVMVGLSENPPNSLKLQSCYNSINPRVLFSLKYLETAICSFLQWLIKSLNNNPNTSLVMRILSIVAIKKSNSLLLMLFGQPILNKILYLGDVHELDIVDMTILLTLDDNIRRHAFITHSLRICFMVLASSIDFISNLRWRQAIVAFYLNSMYSLAFQLLFFEPVVK